MRPKRQMARATAQVSTKTPTMTNPAVLMLKFSSHAQPEPVSLPGEIGPVTQVAAGGAHSLAVTASGQLYAFGLNGTGELGNAINISTSDPNPTPTL